MQQLVPPPSCLHVKCRDPWCHYKPSPESQLLDCPGRLWGFIGGLVVNLPFFYYLSNSHNYSWFDPFCNFSLGAMLVKYMYKHSLCIIRRPSFFKVLMHAYTWEGRQIVYSIQQLGEWELPFVPSSEQHLNYNYYNYLCLFVTITVHHSQQLLQFAYIIKIKRWTSK